MISEREIIEKSRGYGVFISTIERDYAQNWLLAFLDKFDMGLKGGTGIKKVFIKDYRFSDDLDFTMTKPYEKDTIEGILREVLLEGKEESGIQFRDTINLSDTDNGFNTWIQFIGPKTKTPVSIKIDMTLHEKEIILLPLKKRIILHDYSDSLNHLVNSYSLEEIVAEKLRSLFQRARARDVYDTWRLAEMVDKATVHKILSKKFEFKQVLLDIHILMEKRDTLASAWKAQLQHQIKDIPDFDTVFSFVLSEIEFYKEIKDI